MSGETACKRCGVPCRPAGPGDPEARLLRWAQEGVCAGCALTQFLRTTEPLATVIASQGTDCLMAPPVQAQVGAVLAAAHSDATLDEIDWAAVVANWNLPLAAAGGER